MNNKRQLLKGLSAAPLWSLPVVSTIVLPLHAQASNMPTDSMPTGSLAADVNISISQCPASLNTLNSYQIDDITDPENPVLLSLSSVDEAGPDSSRFNIFTRNDSQDISFEWYSIIDGQVLESEFCVIGWNCDRPGYFENVNGDVQRTEFKSMAGVAYIASWNISINTSGPQGVEFNNLVFTPK